ncbi:lysozyme-like, partial [Lytechinus variegatus]|uniref:lysozyme-like n=1 Tax=Lytechinus variegatus TaxID=7654 RepID=UPI001BB10C07
MTISLPTPVSPDCLACICKVESGCTIPDPVCHDDVGSLSCGPYQIKEAYWNDARLRGGELKGSWMNCTAEFECSEQAVQGYMARYATFQRLGRQPTCQDFARIHNGGPDGYDEDGTLGYWENAFGRYEECRCAAGEPHKWGEEEE